MAVSHENSVIFRTANPDVRVKAIKPRLRSIDPDRLKQHTNKENIKPVKTIKKSEI